MNETYIYARKQLLELVRDHERNARSATNPPRALRAWALAVLALREPA